MLVKQIALSLFHVCGLFVKMVIWVVWLTCLHSDTDIRVRVWMVGIVVYETTMNPGWVFN